MGPRGRTFLRSVAVSLGADAEFFADKYDKPLQRTQCVFYPPRPVDDDEGVFGVAPHTDYGCVTLLWQDEVGGLEVQGPDGGWIPAPPIPGALVVNIGDLLARWSNDRYRSNLHRVTNRWGRERARPAPGPGPAPSAGAGGPLHHGPDQCLPAAARRGGLAPPAGRASWRIVRMVGKPAPCRIDRRDDRPTAKENPSRETP